MKTLGEVLASFLAIAGWLALFFIFWGTPDVWDKWHSHAMEKCSSVTEGDRP